MRLFFLLFLILPFLSEAQIYTKIPARSRQVATATNNVADQSAGTTVATEKVGINIDPEYTLDVNGVDAIRVPVGTTAQRPLTPQAGIIRFNSTTKRFEGYNGTKWVNLSLPF